MNTLVPIEGKKNLVRDPRSMGIISTDRVARTKYLNTKTQILNGRREIEELKQMVLELSQRLKKLEGC